MLFSQCWVYNRHSPENKGFSHIIRCNVPQLKGSTAGFRAGAGIFVAYLYAVGCTLTVCGVINTVFRITADIFVFFAFFTHHFSTPVLIRKPQTIIRIYLFPAGKQKRRKTESGFRYYLFTP